MFTTLLNTIVKVAFTKLLLSGKQFEFLHRLHSGKVRTLQISTFFLPFSRNLVKRRRRTNNKMYTEGQSDLEMGNL